MASETTTELANKIAEMLESQKIGSADDMRMWIEQFLVAKGVDHADAERIAKAIEGLPKDQTWMKVLAALLGLIPAIVSWLSSTPGSSPAHPLYIAEPLQVIVQGPVDAQLVDVTGAPIGQDTLNPLVTFESWVVQKNISDGREKKPNTNTES